MSKGREPARHRLRFTATPPSPQQLAEIFSIGAWFPVEIKPPKAAPRRSPAPPVMVRLVIDQAGQLSCTGLLIGGFDFETLKPGLPLEITARQLRDIPLSQILSFAPAEFLETMGVIGASVVIRRRPGPTGHPDDHYKSIAALYKKAIKERPRAPVQEVTRAVNAERPRNDPMSEVTIRRWVKRAKAKGYITSTKGGRKR